MFKFGGDTSSSVNLPEAGKVEKGNNHQQQVTPQSRLVACENRLGGIPTAKQQDGVTLVPKPPSGHFPSSPRFPGRTDAERLREQINEVWKSRYQILCSVDHIKH